MEDIDIIDGASEPSNKETPQAVKTLAILSIVGSSIWSLLLLIAMFWFISVADGVNRFMPVADPGGLIAIIVVVCLLLIALNVVGIIAAMKMNNGKKSAFILYAIVTGIWALLMLLGSTNEGGNALNVISGLASIGFIIAFGVKMKEMPN